MFVYFSFVKSGFCTLMAGQINSSSKRTKRVRQKVSRKTNNLLLNRQSLIMRVKSIILYMGWLIRTLVRISKNLVKRGWDSIIKVKYRCVTSCSKTTTTLHTTLKIHPHSTSKLCQNFSNRAPKTPNPQTQQKNPRMLTNFCSS